MLTDIITFIFSTLILLYVLAAGFAVMFSSALAGQLVRKAFVTLIGFFVVLTVLEHLATEIPLLGLLILSPLAYAIWIKRHGHVSTRTQPVRGVERTPIVPLKGSE